MEMVTEIVARGNEIESDASRVLWAASSGEIGTDGLSDVDQAVTAGAHFALDPDADPQEVEDWWNGLSPEQQQWIAADRPDWVRNRDGIPTVVRDGANMRWLDAERTRLQAELDRELAAHPNPNVPPYGIRADRTAPQDQRPRQDSVAQSTSQTPTSSVWTPRNEHESRCISR